MIVGTAGHIDHGKSALIAALTRHPMDRLPEERRRGITIDLNFAPLDLGGPETVGVVDVPGHEDFVRTMAAGASGMDLALLVVAADEGVMPQTREHLAILEYLEVPAAIPVVTKADLADPESVELCSLEIAELVADSRIAFEPPVIVSAKTGHGLDHLRERLRECARAVDRPRASDAFRLPVDRAFSVAGVGTVVTGTAWSGQVRVGDAVAVLPRGRRGRVRSIESFGTPLERGDAGSRVALALAGVDRDEVRRGDLVVTDALPWTPVTALDVELAVHRSAPRPLVARSRVRLLLGTAEIMARVLPRSPIEPGTTGLARLSLEEPAVARALDRFVLRSFSPVATIGGGWVVDPLPPRRRSVWQAGLAASDPADRLRALMARRPLGVSAALLPLVLGLPESEARRIAAADSTLRSVAGHWVPVASMDALATRALTLLKAHHRGHRSELGMPLETLRRSLGAPAWQVEAVLDDLTGARRLRRLEGLVAMPGFVPRVEGGDAEIDRVVQILVDAHLMPPSITELERQTGRRDVTAILRLAAGTGRVEAVEHDRYYARQALDRLIDVLRAFGHDEEIAPATVRDRLGISRKYLIPLLEWADAKGITVRNEQGRRRRA